MAKEIPNVEDRVLIVEGTGPEKKPPPYHTNKPGVPPGAVPEELKAQMRRARMARRAERG